MNKIPILAFVMLIIFSLGCKSSGVDYEIKEINYNGIVYSLYESRDIIPDYINEVMTIKRMARNKYEKEKFLDDEIILKVFVIDEPNKLMIYDDYKFYIYNSNLNVLKKRSARDLF
ncbi:MAG: hypothetical protein SOZ40_06435 [Ezakiella sp.]|nr:hypothetical protein [Ezakiella sp.]MDD7761229.1 hypothetical protein [Bacillota bacterium]MDY3947600.1 hypothetical protein [Ezakiella sp.]